MQKFNSNYVDVLEILLLIPSVLHMTRLKKMCTEGRFVYKILCA